MPIPVSQFNDALDLKELVERLKSRLGHIAQQIGLSQETEVRTKNSQIDVVWYLEFKHELLENLIKLPLIAFEIETTWRTRKHLKGDIFNLLEISPSLGIVLLLEEGFKKKNRFKGNFKAIKSYAESYRGIARIDVWTEKDIELIENNLNSKILSDINVKKQDNQAPKEKDFQNEINNIINKAEQENLSYVEINAGSLHRKVGNYPGDHRMPICCQVMRKNMGEFDTVLSEPEKGKGASLTVRYKIPRKTK